MLFKDRQDAGRQLAARLLKYKEAQNTVVLGLARGGMVTAAAVADVLHLPLNVVVVRKIGAPGNEELAIGAIAEQGEGIFNDHLIGVLGVSSDYVKKETERQRRILKERLALYREKAPPLHLKDATVILVDDGMATGASMRVAIASMRERQAKEIVLAVPVAASDALRKISTEVDEVVCLSSPVFFEAVGRVYRSFEETSDEEVVRLLAKMQGSEG